MQASEHLWRKEPDKLTGATGRQPLYRDMTHATLLERERALGREQMRGKFAKAGLMSDKCDAMTFRRPTQLVHHLSRGVARGECVERLDRRLVAETVGEQRGRLFRAAQTAGRDLVDVDVEPGERVDRCLETIDPSLGERSLRIVRPFVAAFRSYRMAYEIQVAGLHASGGGAAGANSALACLHQPIAHRDQSRASGHVVAVQLAAFGFQPTYESIEVSRHLQCRRARRALDAPRPRNEDLQVVHASQQVLHVPQRPQRCRIARPAVTRDRIELERIPQLFDGDSHVVKSIRKVHSRRVFDGGAEPTRTSRRPFTRPRDSLGIMRGLFVCALARHGNGALAHFLDVEIVEPLAYVFLQTPSFVGNGGPQPVDGWPRNLVALFELIENEQRDIEFASRTEQPREASDAARHLVRLASGPEYRQSRPQTAGRHPCLVERLCVAILRGGQCTSQRSDTL